MQMDFKSLETVSIHSINLIDEKRVEKFYSNSVAKFIVDFYLVNSC